MIITGMEEFQSVCKNHLVRTYNKMSRMDALT